MDARTKVVIPARYASKRLPGKPLMDIAGRTMLEHVWTRAVESGATDVVIATDDERVANAAEAFGADVAITRDDHSSGTDRIAEVAATRGWSDADLVVNLQGDEPLMPPELLVQVAGLLAATPWAGVATLATPLTEGRDYRSPDVVKVVAAADGRALYFSRASIPCERGVGDARVPVGTLRHLGLYAYRVEALRRITSEPACRVERQESLEQLRALWLGIPIVVAEASVEPGHGVDSEEDLAAVRARLAY